MILQAEKRTQTGTSASKRDRRAGKIPVTLYGRTVDTQSLLIDRREFEAILRKEGTNAVFKIAVDGKEQQVWIKDFDKAVLKDTFYSVDLEAISADQKLEVEVSLVLENEETVKVGIVELVENVIVIETTPGNIPSNFTLDVSGMEIGDIKEVSDLDVPEGVEVLMEPDQTIVVVSAPTEEPDEDAEDGEMPEPEVITERSDDEDAGEE